MSLTKVTYSMIQGAVVNALDYGAVADDSTDCKAAFQAAINAAIASNANVFIPAGTYKISGELTVPSGSVQFFGEGYGSVLNGTFATGNMFTIASENPVCFYNLRITSTVAKTAGAAIYYDAGSAKQNNFSVIDSCFFDSQFNGVYCYRNGYQKITNNQFTTNSANGKSIFLGNATTPDSGDQIVAYNQIYGGSGVVGVYQTGGGGTRIFGNKFLQIQNGYYCQFTGTAQTGIVMISDNSFDGCTGSSLIMTSTDTSRISDITITGNVFDGFPADAFMYFQAAGSGAVGRMAITGNTVIQNAGSVDIITLNKVGDAIVSGNSFAGTGAIYLTADCVDCVISNNLLEGVSIANGSASTYVANPRSDKVLYSNGGLLLGSEISTTATGILNTVTPAGTANVFNMYKDTQVVTLLGHKGSTDTNFYIGSGSTTIGTYGVYLTNTGSSWNAVSDETAKNIIEPIESGLDKVATLRAVIGSYKNDPDNTPHPFLIAQDVQKVLPEAVSVQDKETGLLGLSYTDVIPLLVSAIKELKAEVDALKAK